MAHGNASDVAFLSLLAIVVQWLAFPDTLFKDLGPLKAQFSSKTADLDAILTLGAGMLLTLGISFSGVKWNPINGKMGGIAGFITIAVVSFSTFEADGYVFVPRLLYVYLAVLFVGTMHIMFFPSNPLVKTVDPATKNNHGNMSDMVAMALMVCAGVSLFYPDHLFMDLGPLKAQFKTKTSELSIMIKFVSLLMFMWACLLSGVKWNPINGKGAGLGCFLCSGYTAYSTFKADKDVFVPRMFYIYAALMFLSALHIFVFPSNPMPPKPNKTDEKKEK